MSKACDGSVPRFGSLHRAGRDDHAYQEDRMRSMCAFSMQLLNACREQLRDEQRRGREIWLGKQWIEGERDKAQQVIKNMQAWTRELEDARIWHTAECQRLTKLVEDLQETVARQARRIAELEQRIRGVSGE